MAEMKVEPKRYRFSVPPADTSVMAWVEQQSNLSMSLRMLIGECIERNGYGDYTCRERIPGAKRGRPAKITSEDEQDASHEEFSDAAPKRVVKELPPKPVPSHIETNAQRPAAVSKTVPQNPGILSDDDIAAMFG